MVRKATRVNQGDLLAEETEFLDRVSQRAEWAGVRALIVTRKLRNGSGVKGRRKVDW